jgi:hypothetical protein
MPAIGHQPVDRIGVAEVLQILEGDWRAKPATMTRVRGRIETVLDYALARGWYSGSNVARWRGLLDQLLPSRTTSGQSNITVRCLGRSCHRFTSGLSLRIMPAPMRCVTPLPAGSVQAR